MKDILVHQIYKAVDQRAKAKGPDFFAQLSFIQLEALVPQGGGVIEFNINNLTTSRNTERRLNINDAFVCAKLGLFLKEEDSAKAGSKMLETYPNVNAFTAEAGNVTLDHLKSIYNSQLKLKVGDKVYSEAIDMSRSFLVPTSQQTSGTTFSERRDEEGMFLLDPIVTFEGSGKNEVTLKIPSFAGQQIQHSTAGAGNSIYAVIKMVGFLVTGGSGLGQVNNNS